MKNGCTEYYKLWCTTTAYSIILAFRYFTPADGPASRYRMI